MEPTSFQFWLDFGGRNFLYPNGFTWDNQVGVLTFFSEYGTRFCRKMQPTKIEWESLWDTCDQIDVWSWPEILLRYKDGFNYLLKIKVGERKTINKVGGMWAAPAGIEDKLVVLHDKIRVFTGWPDYKQLGFSLTGSELPICFHEQNSVRADAELRAIREIKPGPEDASLYLGGLIHRFPNSTAADEARNILRRLKYNE